MKAWLKKLAYTTWMLCCLLWMAMGMTETILWLTDRGNMWQCMAYIDYRSDQKP